LTKGVGTGTELSEGLSGASDSVLTKWGVTKEKKRDDLRDPMGTKKNKKCLTFPLAGVKWKKVDKEDYKLT